jgi:hypothetical protein
MDLQVLVQIGFLGEGEVASVVVADVGSLLGVDSEMIVEVVPFSEDLAAAGMGTA